jgi:hypothetical protein
MTRPSSLVCFAGRPRVCLALIGLCAVIVLGWLNHEVSWWVGIIALGAAKRTLTAYGELKRYNAWRAKWDAMGPPQDTPAPAPRAQRAAPHNNVGGRVLLGIAALIAVSIPFSGSASSDGVLCVWFGACVFLVWKLIGAIRRKGTGSGAAVSRRVKGEASGDGAVTWLLPRAASSPSCVEAMRNLPEYSARLIGR